MRAIVWVLVAMLAACAWQRPAKPLAPRPAAGVHERELEVGDRDRRFLLAVPQGAEDTDRVPLVIVLHRRGGSARQALRDYGIAELVEQHGFVAAFPETTALWGWSAGGLPLGDAAADLAFLDTLLDTLEGELPIDRDRIFCCGHSSGGIMAYDYARHAPTRLAAIGVVAGSIGIRGPGRRTLPAGPPVSVVHIHGTGDARVPYDAEHGADATWNLFVSAPDSVATWAERNGGRRIPREANTGGYVDRWLGPDDIGEVALHTRIDGPHAWPRGMTFDAAHVLWDFFESHPRGQ